MTFVQSSTWCCPDHAQRYEYREVGSVEMTHGKEQGFDSSRTDCLALHTEEVIASLIFFGYWQAFFQVYSSSTQLMWNKQRNK